jgi:hypothetical protein
MPTESAIPVTSDRTTEAATESPSVAVLPSLTKDQVRAGNKDQKATEATEAFYI